MAVVTKHYIGEVGTEILVNCGRDITAATVTKLRMSKPDGTVVELDASKHRKGTEPAGETWYLQYITLAATFSVSGEYEVQSKVTMGTWSGLGETAKFIVYEQFS